MSNISKDCLLFCFFPIVHFPAIHCPQYTQQGTKSWSNTLILHICGVYRPGIEPRRAGDKGGNIVIQLLTKCGHILGVVALLEGLCNHLKCIQGKGKTIKDCVGKGT